MIKKLLRLLAASANFVAVLLVANVAIAATQIDNASLPSVDSSKSQLVNLNVVSPSLKIVQQSDNILLDHLGCSCAVCTQGINTTSSNI